MNDSGFSIAVLGGRGVGKTSMLTAMSHDFERSVDDVSLQLNASPQTRLTMDQRLYQLMRVAGCTDASIDPGKMGIGGTAIADEYTFQLKHLPSDTSFDLIFHDYPGGYLQDLNRCSYIRNVLAPASVILVAFDTPALMQLNGEEHEAINMPSNLKNVLAAILSTRSDLRRLVMFVPMRCERWLVSNKSALLYEAFLMRFQSMIKLLSYYKNSIDVLYSPIQTLGSVQFQRYHERRALFERIDSRSFAPVDCEQILRYTIRHLLLRCQSLAEDSLAAEKRNIAKLPWYIRIALEIGSKVGVEAPSLRKRNRSQKLARTMFESLAEYSACCKETEPFRWIQQVPNGLATSSRPNPSQQPVHV